MFRFFLNGPFRNSMLKTDGKRLEASGEKSGSAFSSRDPVFLGGLAGSFGILTRDGYSFLAKTIGLAKFYVWNISAGLFMERKYVNTFFGNTVGILADIVLGAVIGIVFVYFIKFTNHKNFLIKAWGIGMAAWLLLFGIVFHSLPGTDHLAPQEALSNLSAFIGHSIFGISIGIYAQILLKRFGVVDR